jgi:hypothetical protein
VITPAPCSNETTVIHTREMQISAMTKMTRNLATKAANFFIVKNHTMRYWA